MKIRNRFIAVGIAGAMAVSLVACAEGDESTADDTTQEAVVATDSAETPTNEEDAADELAVDDAADESIEEEGPTGEQGTRDNPLPLGATLEGEEWSVTVNSVELNADDAVAAENQFNEPAPEGHAFALFNVTAEYNGDDSEMVMLGTSFAFVTATGETIQASDTFEVAPNALDGSQELYGGGTATGNVIIAIPEQAEGTLRVETGFVFTEEAFFAIR